MNDAEIMSVVFVAVMVAFYLMFLRPIHKDQEKHRQQIRDLRPGDEVVTTSNFIGTIKDIQVPAAGQTRITIELAEGVVITALPGAILQRLSSAPDSSPEKPARPSEGSEGSFARNSSLRSGCGEPASGQPHSTGSGQASV